MATESEILRLRRAADIPEDDPIYTDEVLGAMIDELGFNMAACTLWREKASSYAGLVDITESGSSRRFSQLYSQALAMAGSWCPKDDDVTAPGTSGGSYTIAIERM